MSDGIFNALHESCKPLHEEADPMEHPFNQYRARKGAEGMAKIASHYKKSARDLTADEITRYNQRNFKKGDPLLQEEVVNNEPVVLEETPAARPQSGTKGLRVTYEIVTPESAESGEADESGFLDEEGIPMDPDEIDAEEGITAVDNAVKFLQRNTGAGGLEWDGGTSEHGWWTSYKYDVDYQTGGEESRGYHPYGFTQEEVDAINAQLMAR